MTNLVPFSFESREVRILTDNNGEPLFVAKDVAEALGYTWNGTARIEHVPSEWRGATSVVTPSGMQEMAVLTEQGFYFFLNRSDKPGAIPMQKLVAGEILPAIRKTGRYEAPKAEPTAAHVKPREIREAFTCCLSIAKLCGLRDNAARLAADIGTRKLTGQSALALIENTHLAADPRGQTYTPTEIGKMLEPPLSAVKTNRLIETSGLQVKDIKGEWIPTGAADGLYEWPDTNKRHSDGTPVKQLKWFEAVTARLAQEAVA